jgi:hypothetical protein
MSIMVDIKPAIRWDAPSCQMLAGRTSVMILLGVVDEVLPGEQAALGVTRRQRLRHAGQHAGLLASQNLIAIEGRHSAGRLFGRDFVQLRSVGGVVGERKFPQAAIAGFYILIQLRARHRTLGRSRPDQRETHR